MAPTAELPEVPDAEVVAPPREATEECGVSGTAVNGQGQGHSTQNSSDVEAPR